MTMTTSYDGQLRMWREGNRWVAVVRDGSLYVATAHAGARRVELGLFAHYADAERVALETLQTTCF